MNPVVIEPDLDWRMRGTLALLVVTLGSALGMAYYYASASQAALMVYMLISAGLLCYGLFYFLYFRRGIVLRIELTDEGLTIRRRSGHVDRLSWRDVTYYNYDESRGRCTWQLFTNDLTIGLVDYLFSASEWQQISDRIIVALGRVETAKQGRPDELSQSTQSWLGIVFTALAVITGILTWRNDWGVNGVVISVFILLLAAFMFGYSMSQRRSRIIGIPVIAVMVLGPIVFVANMWVQEKRIERERQREAEHLQRELDEFQSQSDEYDATMQRHISMFRKEVERLRADGKQQQAEELENQIKALQQRMDQSESRNGAAGKILEPGP